MPAITQLELGRRIRKGREACGLTQDQVASHLAVSRPAIAQIEAGRRSVSSLELAGFAHLFGRDMRELVAAEEPRERDPLSALFRAEPDVTGDAKIVERLCTCLAIGRELSSLERLLGVHQRLAPPKYDLPTPASRWSAIQQGEHLAEQERRRLELGKSPAPDLTELLDSCGVRAGLVDLPADISGLTLHDENTGFIVVANGHHASIRRRFSFTHEYAHVLADGGELALVSRGKERDKLVEVRANAFAAAFLMPADGVRYFIADLGKGSASRLQADVFDEAASIVVEARSEPGSQDIQLFDVVLLAHHFDVSCIAALYRLRNLRLITSAELDRLKQQDEKGTGRRIEKTLSLPSDRGRRDEAETWFRRRLLGLGLEAYRREAITRAKLRELAALVGLEASDLDTLATEAGIAEEEQGGAETGDAE